nr:UBN2 domain-containing protein [Tanacetum cinerariifolium]
KFLKALPTKWRPKVTAIKESKDLSTLPLDELIGNLKVYEVVLEKESEASKNKKEEYKSLALKSKKVSSDEEALCLDSDDEEYAMTAFIGGCWRDSEEDDYSKKDEICLMALDDNEGFGFTEDRVSTSKAKIGKLGQESGKMPTVEPTEPVPSAKEPACVLLRNRLPAEDYENLDSNACSFMLCDL